MFNNNKEIVQWYFDITKQHGVDNRGIPFFDDLYLDVIVLPSSEILLLDEDELKEALDKEELIKDEYYLAYREAKILTGGIALNVKDLNKLSYQYLEYINNQPTAIER